jgi:hypothetical protein
MTTEQTMIPRISGCGSCACHNHLMAFTHLIVPAAGLQPYEQANTAFNPWQYLPHWREDPAERIELHPDSLTMPFEMAYARTLGLPSDEGLIPWAAFETQTVGQPCAWLHLCHLDVGMTDMVMQPTERLRLTDAESRELLALLAPYFEQDGIALKFHSAGRWLALGEPFAALECTSLARVQGRSINAFLPDAGEFPQQTQLMRLQAEVQMLLYPHPASEARSSRGLPTVNSFWIDGAGLLNALPAPSGAIKLEMRLHDAADNPSLYASAWRALAAEWAQQAAQALAQGDEFLITLCGEKSAVTLPAQKPDWKHKFLSLLGRQPTQNMRKVL